MLPEECHQNLGAHWAVLKNVWEKGREREAIFFFFLLISLQYSWKQKAAWLDYKTRSRLLWRKSWVILFRGLNKIHAVFMSQEGKRNLNHISHQLRLRNMKDFKDIHGLLLWKYLVNEPLVGDKFFMEFWFWKDHILNASFGKQRRACVCVFVCERERKNRRERNGEREKPKRSLSVSYCIFQMRNTRHFLYESWA